MTELCDLTATEARDLISLKAISPVELLQACLERVDQLNPKLNAVITLEPERAMREARAAEQAVMKGEPLGLLHGLPTLIKDVNETAGIRTTYCSHLFKDNVPDHDDPVVGRMRSQGAIVFGKTNAPEFGIGANTRNRLFGATGNAFAPNLTCGGSSGGAGVALATGMAPIANGGDGGCSIRNPAAFSGITGLRPSPGLVSVSTRHIGLTMNNVQGPFGRTVKDAALLLSAQADYDTRDMMSFPQEQGQFNSLNRVDLSSIKVAFSEDLGFAPVDKVVRETFRKKLALFGNVFAKLDEYPVDMKTAEATYWVLRGMEVLAKTKKTCEEYPGEIDEIITWHVKAVENLTAEDVADAFVDQTRIYHEFQKLFDHHDVLITPAVNVLPFDHNQPYPKIIEGRAAAHYSEWYSLSYAISMMGHPAIVVPVGLDPQGTPFGIQIVGRRLADKKLLELALALEIEFLQHPDLKRPVPNIKELRNGS